MQRLTFEMIESRSPLPSSRSQQIKSMMSEVGYLNPAIIIETDNTVTVDVDKNVYKIKSNLELKTIQVHVAGQHIILPSKSFGVQEILINLGKSNTEPSFGEITGFSVTDTLIDLGNTDYDSKLAYVKYLTSRN